MNWKEIDLFPEAIREQVLRIRREAQAAGSCPGGEKVGEELENTARGLVLSLVVFHSTILATKRYRGRKGRAEEILRELDPDFAKGYLETEKII